MFIYNLVLEQKVSVWNYNYAGFFKGIDKHRKCEFPESKSTHEIWMQYSMKVMNADPQGNQTEHEAGIKLLGVKYFIQFIIFSLLPQL